MAKPLWILYHIKKEERDGEEEVFFDRVGRAVEGEKGFSVWLETLPVGVNTETQFFLQKYKPKEKREASTFSD